MTKPKKIKLKDKVDAMLQLQNWLINKKVSNAGLISLSLHGHIRRFLDGLEEIYLSEELQTYAKRNKSRKS